MNRSRVSCVFLIRPSLLLASKSYFLVKEDKLNLARLSWNLSLTAPPLGRFSKLRSEGYMRTGEETTPAGSPPSTGEDEPLRSSPEQLLSAF